MLVRLLFWFGLALAGWWLFRSGTKPRVPANPDQPQASRTPLAQMNQCAYCGVHFPASDGADAPDGRAFCSAAHRSLALNVNPK